MTLQFGPQQFAADGVALERELVPAALLRTINEVMRARAKRVMDALGTRPIGIGSRNGFHELVQRSPGRFDVPMSESDLAPIWGAQGSTAPEVPWLQMVRSALGPDARPAFCGVVIARFFVDDGSGMVEERSICVVAMQRRVSAPDFEIPLCAARPGVMGGAPDVISVRQADIEEHPRIGSQCQQHRCPFVARWRRSVVVAHDTHRVPTCGVVVRDAQDLIEPTEAH